MNNLKQIREDVTKKLGELSSLKEQLELERKEMDSTNKEIEDLLQAQSIAQSVAQTIQQKAHVQIASVVSRCLESVFDEPYLFKILFEQKRGKTEAKLVFERDGMEVDPLTASGGGVIDVASFALRLSCLMLSKPKLRRVLVMDEPFKFVSQGYRENVKSMLEELSKELKIQIIFVTHIEELVTGKVITL